MKNEMVIWEQDVKNSYFQIRNYLRVQRSDQFENKPTSDIEICFQIKIEICEMSQTCINIH